MIKASGILDDEPSLLERVCIEAKPGAVVTKSLTLKPRKGYDPPILIACPTGGYINAVGLANPGIHACRDLVEACKKHGVPVIVSVAASCPEEAVELASKADEAGADAIELNLSCPHAKGYGLEVGSEPSTAKEVVAAATSVVKIPVIAKLGLNDKLLQVSSAVLDAGARALTLINTVRAMIIDVYAMKPVLSNIYGGLSGEPIHPLAVKAVYDVYKELRAEIIGCGGVTDWRTAIELCLAGARAVQIATAVIDKGLVVFKEILDGIRDYMKKVGVKSWLEIVGAAHRD